MASEVANEALHIPEPRMDSCGRFDEFIELARYQRDHVLPQNRNEYTATYEKAFADTLDANAEFRAFFDYVLRDMQDVEPENVLRRTLKTFQHIEKSNNYMTFPQDYDTPKAWERPFREVLEDGDYQDQFFGNIFLPIMSNVSERGVLLKTVALLHEKREQVRILDMGCSLNDVLHRLALEQTGPVPELAYNQVDVMRREPRKGSRAELDPETTRRFNDWLTASPLDVGPSVGIDALPFDEDERLRARALSDSRYMGELVMSHLSAQLYLLAKSNPPQVSFKSYDAATFDPAVFGQTFDIAYGSTMLYQTPRETRRDILRNAQAVTESDGLVIYQDFIRRMGTQGGMQFYKRWLPYTYGVWVHDKQRPDLGFQKYFTVYSGRVEKVIPNETALGRLPVAAELGLVRS